MRDWLFIVSVYRALIFVFNYIFNIKIYILDYTTISTVEIL